MFLGDRESDLYEYFEKAVRNYWRFISRRIHNRQLKDTENIKTFLGGIDPAGLYRKESLRDSADTVPLRADCGHSLKIPRDSHTGREAREAKLEVKYETVLIPRPQNAAKDIADALQLRLISAVEIDAPEGIEAISWQLISNLNVDSYETARTYINWYSKRWMIEMFHYTLKSGCAIERLQADTAEVLCKEIATYSIIATKIMYATYLVRTDPDVSCEEFLTEIEWKVLCCTAKKTKDPPKTRIRRKQV